MHACNSPAAPVLRAARGLSARSARARLVASPLAARRRSGAASTFMADGQSEGMVWRQGYYEKAGNGDLVWRRGSYAARGAAAAAAHADASGEGGETDERRRKKAESLRDIAAEFNAQILTGKRERKKTTMEIDGHTVLKANNYSLEEGESSVFAREVKQKKQETSFPF